MSTPMKSVTSADTAKTSQLEWPSAKSTDMGTSIATATRQTIRPRASKIGRYWINVLPVVGRRQARASHSALAARCAPANARAAGYLATELGPGCSIAVNRLAFGEGVAPPARAILPDGERLPGTNGSSLGILLCLAAATALV